MKISIDQEYTTRDGGEVELWKFDESEWFGRYKRKSDGTWAVCQWCENGWFTYPCEEHSLDLIEVPKPKKRLELWQVIEECESGYILDNKLYWAAQDGFINKKVATIEIDEESKTWEYIHDKKK